MIHKKLLSLLVLLMTAASGAWAQEETLLVTINASNDFCNGSKTFENKVKATFSSSVNCGATGWYGSSKLTVTHEAGYTITRVKFFTTKGDAEDTTDPFEANLTQTSINDGTPNQYRHVSVNGTMIGPNNQNCYLSKIEVYGIAPEPDVEVTTNKAEGETTFTEATFAMPAFDATVNYDIVRDMADTDNPVEFSGLAERVVVKKKTGSEAYEPVTPLTIQLLDQLAATDAQNIIADAGIKVNVLKGTLNGTTITYDEAHPLPLDAFTADMKPGYYKIVAEPTDATTSPYIGTASLAFEALAGFPVEIAAQEYVTYYSASDNLTLEENSGAKLYTITNVGETKATATEIPSANKEMPFLVYNPTEETKTFLLIPTDDAADDVNVFPGFVGTAEATTIAASTDAQTNYAFNGKQFVRVRTALPVAANKAWLEVPTSTARSIALVFADDDATAISAVSGSPADKAAVYDLSGRKVTNPAKKGVYIVNGKKVIIK